MPQDKEHEIRLQFLEEAQEYLNTIESSIIELSAAEEIDHQKIDSALRAAHSIKGGAAMMEFQTLSHLAHRLEDFFKVLNTQKHGVNSDIEKILLTGVDCLRRVVDFNLQNVNIDQQWIENHVAQVFEQLEQQLGNFHEDTAAPISPEAGMDNNMVVMIFETEVEDYLQRLEAALANPEKSGLLEEVATMAQELGDLGEMLQLAAFKSLCASIAQYLEASPEEWEETANLALQAWRRSQVAIMAGETNNLPTEINFGNQIEPTAAAESQGINRVELCPIPGLFKTDEISMPTDIAADSVDSAADTFITPSTTTELSELISELTSTNNVQETQENTVRVPIRQLEQLNDLFGELTIERNGITLYLERLRNSVRILEGRVRKVQQSYTRIQAAYEKQDFLHEHFPNPPSVKNDLQLPSQEVIQNITQLREVTDDIDLSLKDADQTASELNWTAKQLQTCITQLRMRPLSDLVGRFPRALRELSLQYGKKVELKVHGDNTLIERGILEALSDPLMHLLRNAFDHGIEDPATRQAGGKPEQGVIEIKAVYRGNQTLISFSDDGSGIDLDKVRVRGRQLGLDPVAIASASDAELLTLIFEPGFSTADEVTALSGRGVGMDVVRTNLRQVRGDIKVDTELGRGTTFTISVPFTLSVARVLLVESKGMLLALPNHAIAEMVLLNSEQILTVAGKEVLSWKKQMLPLIRLSDWLKFRSPKFTANNDTTPMMNAPTVLIVAQGDEWVGLQVDRCWGEQEVAIRPVEGTMLSGGNRVGAIAMPPGFTGCTILGDGRVVPLLSASELLHWIASYQQSHAQEQENKLQTSTTSFNQKHTVLVVDDSINVRRFLSLSLEKAGYRVEQAKDGQDALEKLLNGLQPNAVICDVDMPHLDGYGFLSQVKSNSTFKHLPIMMLTSRSGEKERQLALNLGATAFFSKPYNKQELLQTLEQVIE